MSFLEGEVGKTLKICDHEDYEKIKQQRYREVLSKARIILCTNSVVPTLRKLWAQIFSVQIHVKAWILDEAGATAESSCAQGLALRPQVVCLIGDHKQLPPHVNLPAKSLANTMIDRSLMERVINAGAKRAVLTTQYRMHPKICRISSELFYAGMLETAEGLRCTTGPIAHAACWYDCQGCEERSGVGCSWINRAEAKNAVGLAKWIVSQHDDRSIGILSAYSGQSKLITKMVNDAGLAQKVRVATIDSSQGGEYDLLIISTVRSNDKSNIGFCSDTKRINVAITRAKHAIAIIGDAATMSVDRNWKEVWKNCTQLTCAALPIPGSYSPIEEAPLSEGVDTRQA